MRLFVFAAIAAGLTAQAQLPATTQQQIANIATKTLHDTGVPSASIAIAEGGKVVYAQAFGLANVNPPRPAEASMAYPIGSISKQFTAQAILLLQQQGKLSIDDPVAKYFPNFTDAQHVTLRNLMTMTSGYEDFAPQDFIIPAWLHNTDPLANATAWATKPLDFPPGTQWQYSNTNYVILGLIAQRVSGLPLMKLRRKTLLDPLHLQGVFDTYTQRQKLQVTGYVSNAMAPVRVQPLEGQGWYFGDGDLSMTASTLAQWDIDIMQQNLLSPASYKLFETPFTLSSGKSADYGLGIFVRTVNGHLRLEHSGEVGGYVSDSVLMPDQDGGLAVVVLTNEVASDAAHDIDRDITNLLAPALSSPADTLAPRLKALLTDLQHGTIDRTALTPDTSAYFNADTLADFESTLAPLGPIQSVTRTSTALRGGMTYGGYKAVFAKGAVQVSTYLTASDKLEQFLITGKD